MSVARLALALMLLAASCQRAEPTRDHGAPAPAPAPASASAPGGATVASAPQAVDPSLGRRRDVTSFVGGAQRAAIGDLDGDGTNEIVLADAQRLWVVDATGRELATLPAPGGIEVLVVADLDGDHHAAVLAGWGMSREHKTAPATVSAYRLVGGRLVAEPLLAPPTPRAEITAIVPGADRTVLVGYFDSKYTVHSVIVRRAATGWAVDDVATLRMATSYARADVDGDGTPDLIVGRVYGDDQGADGDAFLLRPDGTRVMIPTTRGVRELATADTDGDGRPEIYLADGWHQNYGKLARGLLTEVRFSDGRFRSELVEDTAGQYSVGRIVPADLYGDGKVELVTAGSREVRVFQRRDGRWTGFPIAGVARDIAIGQLDAVAGDEVLVLADRSEVISLP